MLQQCLGANSCMRTLIVMEENYDGCQCSSPFVLNSRACAALSVFPNTLVALLRLFVDEFHHQYSFSIPEYSCHQLSRRLFDFLGMFGEFITSDSYDVIEKFIVIFVVSLYKGQSRSLSLRFMRTREHFRNACWAKLVIA
jgi:hypothetical protein